MNGSAYQVHEGEVRCTVRLALLAPIVCAASIAGDAAGGDEREAEALVAAYLEEITCQRNADDIEVPARSQQHQSDFAAERVEVIRRRVELGLLKAEQRWAVGDLDRPTDLTLRLSDAVALSALQDDAPEEHLESLKYQEDLDYDGDGDVDKEDLARAVQNPVADLISLPLQNNTNFDVGTLNNVQNVLNIQPVIPVHLSEDWNLITRTIVPVIYQPSLFPGDQHDLGLGDIQFTSFFSPKEPAGGWIWGAGPAFRFPTATDARLGARKWSIGPSGVALRMDGPWVYGALIQNLWSIGGSGSRDVNELLIQPFVNYNIPGSGGWYLVSSPIIIADWEANSNNRWLVPLGGGGGKIFRIGDQPMNCQVQAFYNVETPALGPSWTLRLQVQFMFPN